MPLDEYRSANRDNWNDRVPIHVASKTYDVSGFVNNKNELSTIVRFDSPLIGEVKDKTLLHLMCHFGRDTLSWARLGAHVTGIDFSAKAVQAAQELNAAAGLQGRFIESDIYDSPAVLDEQFDIVYTGIGVLCWLPDIKRWAETVSHFLKPGGTFLITEIHPVANSLDLERTDGLLCLTESYFEINTPLRWEDDRTYTDGDATLEHTVTYEWNHGIGEIVSALIESGLRIELVKEYPYVNGWDVLPGMERKENGMWGLPNGSDSVPLMFTIRAVKPQ